MHQIEDTLQAIRLGRPRRFESLTMFPLFGPPAEEPHRHYRLLEDAFSDGDVEVTEVSEAGHVPELLLINRGEVPVLLLDGEELVGAKQNRVLNVTVLAPPGETRLPVSCVEAGRWSWRRRGFRPAGRTQFAEARAQKLAQVSANRRSGFGQARADQEAVWSSIASKARRMGVHSETGAMADLFESYERDIEDYVAALVPEPGQVGALFAMGRRVTGLDLFDHPDTLARSLAKLVRSQALDAIEQRARVQSRDGGFADAWGFLERVAGSDVTSFPSPGLGEDVRLEGERVRGSALVWKGCTLHLVAFDLPHSGVSTRKRRGH